MVYHAVQPEIPALESFHYPLEKMSFLFPGVSPDSGVENPRSFVVVGIRSKGLWIFNVRAFPESRLGESSGFSRLCGPASGISDFAFRIPGTPTKFQTHFAGRRIPEICLWNLTSPPRPRVDPGTRIMEFGIQDARPAPSGFLMPTPESRLPRLAARQGVEFGSWN